MATQAAGSVIVAPNVLMNLVALGLCEVPGIARLGMQEPVALGDVRGVEDAVFFLQRIALGEILPDEFRVDRAIDHGFTATHQFSTAGTYEYVCGFHGGSMRGTVIVE